jgi:polyhydroxyalkanoate synthesis regulator protein
MKPGTEPAAFSRIGLSAILIEIDGGNMASAQESTRVIIRRYGRRRLYDTCHCRYLSIEDLRQWVANGINFVVVDVETGADVTRVLLA